MAASRKIIAVIGATGNQGSSVVHTFLKLPDWHVRCLTRNPSSPASESLSALGAEVVQADLADPVSLSKCLSNATVIFLNTDFWGLYRSPTSSIANDGKACFETEVLYGKNAAHAAAAVPTLERFIYSSLPPMAKVSKGKYTSHHSNSKPAVVDYILTEEPELAKKLSLIYLGGYTNNPFLSPRLDLNTGIYNFIFPLGRDTKFPIIDPKNSTGPFVRALIEDEDAGTKLFAYDSYLTIGEIVDNWSSASEKEVSYLEVPLEVLHEKFGISKEMLDAPAFIAEYGYMGGVDGFIEPFQLKKKVHTKSFKDWLRERDWEAVLDSRNSVKP